MADLVLDISRHGFYVNHQREKEQGESEPCSTKNPFQKGDETKKMESKMYI